MLEHILIKSLGFSFIQHLTTEFSLYQRHFTITFNPLAQVFHCEEEPPSLRSTPWGAHRTRAAISWFPSRCNEPIWNAHILPITIICQVLILPTHVGMEG